MTIQINADIATKVLEVVDHGLCDGMGAPIPGQMCVEAAVCYALGLPHSDDPKCVSNALRVLKIALNDKPWSSNEVRAKGLRRLAVAQLGSIEILDEAEFASRVSTLVIKTVIPKALRSYITQLPLNDQDLTKCEVLALRCEHDPSLTNAENAEDFANSIDLTYDISYGGDTSYWAVDAITAAVTSTDEDGVVDAVDAVSYLENTKTENDNVLANFAESVVQILIDMKAPGCEWLYLTR